MLNNQQFRLDILAPALYDIEKYSPNDEELLVATMAHESKGGTYVHQINGPALGIFQMEPATFDWLWSVIEKKYPMLYVKTMAALGLVHAPDASQLVFNLKLACIMARIRYLITSAEIPDKSDIDGMWTIYKTYYNTSKGDATKQDFVADYYRFIGKN